MSRALSGQKTCGDFDDDIASFAWLRRVTSELAPKPMAAALVVVINVLRFIVADTLFQVAVMQLRRTIAWGLRGRPFKVVEVPAAPEGLVELDHDQSLAGFDLG